MNQKLQNYINEERKLGKSDEIIKQKLRNSGWKDEMFNSYFNNISVYTKEQEIKKDNDSVLDSDSSELPKKSNKKQLFIIVGVLIAALGGLFYYLYNTYPNAPEIILKEKGYQVTVIVKFPKEEMLVKTFRQEEFISDFQKTGNHVLEYLPPGNHVYKFQYKAKNLLGIERDQAQSKQLSVSELSKDELGQYFDFPSLDLTTAKYNILISYSDSKDFSELNIFRNKEKIKTIQGISTDAEIIENVSPDKYSYEIEFSGEEYKNLEGYLRQDYEIEVAPIAPSIISVQPTPLYQGYSTKITAMIENASTCKADLLLYPPSGFEGVDSIILKSFEFTVGDGVNYFYPTTESWMWEEVLFPNPTDTDTTAYNMDIKISCSDYYNLISTEEIGKFPTGKDISQASISISYHYGESDTIFAEISSQIWVDLDCRVLIGDQTNNTLDELDFALQGRHAYEFNISDYNRNFLYVTAMCKGDDNNGVTKISTYKAE